MSDPFNPEPRPNFWTAWIAGPWSWRRVWNGPCAVFARVPGVRAYVLSTTALKEHPMYRYVESPMTKKDGGSA